MRQKSRFRFGKGARILHSEGPGGREGEGKKKAPYNSGRHIWTLPQAKHKWRIINETLLAEYAYVLAVGGRVYAVTDVKELHEWMSGHLSRHPLFEAVPEAEAAEDAVVAKLFESTEEGQKVTRNDGEKWCAVFRRVQG